MMPELDTYLSKVTRRVGSIKGAWRLIEALRRFSAARYRKENSWTIIEDFDGDLKLKVDRSSYLGSCIYWRGYHHLSETLLLSRLLVPQGVFVDVGANQGEFTIYAAKRLPAGKVLAFEPLEPIYQHLVENIRLNGFANVIAYKLGLSDELAVVDMFTTDDINLHHSFNEGLGTLYPTNYRSIRVGVATLKPFDMVFPDSGLDRLDVMKIDVEGAELPVLRGAYRSLKQYKPAIILEINEERFGSAGYTTRDVLDFLRQLDYEVYRIGWRGSLRHLTGPDLPPYCDVLCQKRAN